MFTFNTSKGHSRCLKIVQACLAPEKYKHFNISFLLKNDNFMEITKSYILVLLVWVAVNAIFNGLYFFVAILDQNPFLNFYWSTLMDILGYLILFFIINRFVLTSRGPRPHSFDLI